MKIRLGVSMRSTRSLLIAILTVAAIPCGTEYAQTKTQAQTPAALTGQVISAEEGPMEGVLVTAKESGSTVAVTVVSDEQGHYRIPSAKLEPGHYAITIRAVGYDLDGPTTC
jgi:carboxypeptidase family protein